MTHVLYSSNMNALTILVSLCFPICSYTYTPLWYPPMYWHKDDCRFQSLRQMKGNNASKEVFMKVPYFDPRNPKHGMVAMQIYCPTIHMNNWMEDNPNEESFNENMWRVDKEGYDKCEVNSKGDSSANKLLFTCHNQRKIQVIQQFVFQKTWGMEDTLSVIFEPGQHYYFISTSNGDKAELKTRNVSGADGNCVKHHMKLHIYVCTDSEDCMYELPKCDPPPELYKDMRLINGKLPRATQGPGLKTTAKVSTPRKTKDKVDKQVMQPTTPGGDFDEMKMPICKAEDKGASVQLILNFVLGGVALFMAVVIIILVCGLSDKSKNYETERPASAISTTHGGHIVNAEIVRYSDGHIELSPVVYDWSRTPPTSPSVIIPPYATLQRMNSLRQNTPSESIPTEDSPPEHSPLENPISNLCSDMVQAFSFPDEADQAEAGDSETTSEGNETTSDGVDSSESGPTTTAIVTNPRHDHELNT